MFRRRAGLLIFGIAVPFSLGTGLYAASRFENVARDESPPSFSSPTPAQRGSTYPQRPFNFVDDAESYHDFYQFRQQLRQAIRLRDANFIRSISAQDIKLTLGPPQTWSDLNIDDPKAPIWQEMDKTFALGCRSKNKGESWVCPNIFVDWNRELDSFNYLVVVQDKVPVHAQANTNELVIGFLSKEIVKLDREVQKGAPFNSGWIRIIHPNGQLGYIEKKFTYSPIGYRAAFERVPSGWKLVLFLGGD